MSNNLLENMLERKPVEIDAETLHQTLKGKRALITGAAGSIGSEIVRQIAPCEPELLLLSDIAESPLHQLSLELQDDFPELKFTPLISDIRNKTRMELIFRKYRPQYVFHAAAYKHVPLMETHPSEAVLTNVWGTRVLADLAACYETEVFVMISTDKAVNPSNIMGASKRVAEIYVQLLDAQSQVTGQDKKLPRFIITRFGNVLGSNGSVMLHFKEQIAKGGPLTVTHPQVVRYFMTAHEACQLALEAATMGNGGEVFVFDMGEPVRIVDLAEKMIRLSGLEPYKDIDIVFTGLRPGEKLYEELLANGEHFIPTKNKRIRVGVADDNREDIDRKGFSSVAAREAIDRLIETAHHYREAEVVSQVQGLVPEFVRLEVTPQSCV